MSAGELRAIGPYRGLTPFGDSELDALLFFGREREREIVVANLIASRLTVLYGPSGVGKSSLLRAGVARALRGLPERPVVVVFSSWAEDPASGLAAAVCEEGRLPRAESLKEALSAVGDRDVYLILDQAEEYFLYHGDGETAFEDELASVLREPLRVNVLFSLREDALAKLDRFKGRIPNLFGNSLRLDRLDREAGRTAIVRPVERWNKIEGTGVEVEPALVEAVLDDVGAGRIERGLGGLGAVETNGGRAGIEAPYLQLVMQRLWEVERAEGSERLRATTLGGLGGAPRIVADHLERAMEALAPEQQNVAAGLFNHLVTPSGTKIAHGLADLAEYAGVPEDEVRPVVRTLVGHRILRPDETGRYEIFHDVLAGEVLAWRARFATERALAESHARRVRLRLLTAGALLFAGIFGALALFALVEWNHARDQRREAQHQTSIANSERANATESARAARVAEERAKEAAAITDLRRKEAVEQRAIAERERRKAQHQTTIANNARAKATASARADRAAEERAKTAAAIAERRRKEAVEQKAIADAERANAVQQARLARARELAETADALLVSDPDRAVGLAVRAARLEPTSQKVEDVLRRSLVASHVRALLPGGGGPVRRATFSPDGSLMLVAGGHGGARLYRAGSGSLVHILEKNVFVSTAVFSLDGRLVATADGDGRARLWNPVTGKLVRALAHDGPVMSVAFSADGALLVTSSLDHTARVWRTDTGVPVSVLAHDVRVTSATISPDGTHVVTVSGPPPHEIGPLQARLFDTSTGRLVSLLTERGITTAGFSPNGGLVVTTSTDRTTRLWSASTGDLLRILPQPDGHVLTASFSRDGQRLVTGSKGGTAYIWNVATGQRELVLVGPTGFIESASFSPDGRSVVVASRDRTARIYRSQEGLQMAILAGHLDSVTGAEFSPDGNSVVTASVDGTARVWDAGTKDQLELLGLHKMPVSTASFSPDGTFAVSASDDGTARIWLVAQRRQFHVLPHGGPVKDARFSPDGRLVVTASDDGTARVWNVVSGRELRSFHHGGPVKTAEFSLDGTLVVTASDDGTARVWNVASGREIQSFEHDGPVIAAVFSPGGRMVATASGNEAHIWGLGGRRIAYALRGHEGAVVRVAFSLDGRLLATASGDGTARLWRTSDGAVVHRLRGHTRALTDVEFSRDGRLVVTSSLDGDAIIWDVASGRRLHVLRGHFSSVQTASFSPDGRWVVTAGQIAAGLWQTSTGLLFSVSGSVTDPFLHTHAKTVTSVSFSADGLGILTSSLDGTVRTYRCVLCGGLRELLALAKARLASLQANLAAAERRRYFGQ